MNARFPRCSSLIVKGLVMLTVFTQGGEIKPPLSSSSGSSLCRARLRLVSYWANTPKYLEVRCVFRSRGENQHLISKKLQMRANTFLFHVLLTSLLTTVFDLSYRSISAILGSSGKYKWHILCMLSPAFQAWKAWSCSLFFLSFFFAYRRDLNRDCTDAPPNQTISL